MPVKDRYVFHSDKIHALKFFEYAFFKAESLLPMEFNGTAFGYKIIIVEKPGVEFIESI